MPKGFTLLSILLTVLNISCSKTSTLAAKSSKAQSDQTQNLQSPNYVGGGSSATAPAAATPDPQTTQAQDPSYVSNLFQNLSGPQSSSQSIASQLGAMVSAMANRITHLAAEVLLIENRLSQGSLGGSTFIRWGNKTALPGTELVYAGIGFSSHYGHPRNTEAECLKGGERGGEWIPNYYSNVLYTLATGDRVYMPDSIPSNKTVVCSVLYVPAPTVTIKGGKSCPANWAKLYDGYLLGGHHTHAGGSPNNICVDGENFDPSETYDASQGIAFVYGTHSVSVGHGADFPNLRWLKCAVCAKL